MRFTEGFVAGDDDRSFLVAAGDDLEDEVGVVPVEGEVANFVDDQDGAAQVAAELAAQVRRRRRRRGACGSCHPGW